MNEVETRADQEQSRGRWSNSQNRDVGIEFTAEQIVVAELDGVAGLRGGRTETSLLLLGRGE